MKNIVHFVLLSSSILGTSLALPTIFAGGFAGGLVSNLQEKVVGPMMPDIGKAPEAPNLSITKNGVNDVIKETAIEEAQKEVNDRITDKVMELLV